MVHANFNVSLIVLKQVRHWCCCCAPVTEWCSSSGYQRSLALLQTVVQTAELLGYDTFEATTAMVAACSWWQNSPYQTWPTPCCHWLRQLDLGKHPAHVQPALNVTHQLESRDYNGSTIAGRQTLQQRVVLLLPGQLCTAQAKRYSPCGLAGSTPCDSYQSGKQLAVWLGLWAVALASAWSGCHRNQACSQTQQPMARQLQSRPVLMHMRATANHCCLTDVMTAAVAAACCRLQLSRPCTTCCLCPLARPC